MSEDDLTPQQLRAALAASQQQVADMAAAQDEFLRAVSHDLRAPLRHVTSYGTLVRELLTGLPAEAGASDDVREALGFLATMDQSARRMGLMLDGLLAIARATRAPLLPRPVPLAQALQQAQTQAQAQTHVSSQAAPPVTWRVGADLPALHADPALLQELLVQLLGNAVKFSRGSAQPVVTVTAVTASGAGEVPAGHVAFIIEDNGVGFDPARAGQLFGVFQRLHRVSEFEGVGAGLALCRTIARRHGGDVSATARPGAGCTVRVQWPAKAPDGLVQ
ncbi:sensor histidine kinase [Acidovorax sp. BL-A-41-H1]|uniref:sensor histidine kinase n=1 Tax=Acidovorax sp. BL-A-41-H1 TaxID=3421102 RepID=UPI003F79B7F3